MAFDLQEFLGVCGMHVPEHGEAGARGVCFASGSNRACEIMGFASVGIPIGLCAKDMLNKGGDMKQEPLVPLDRLGGTGLPVFIDSGAYNAYASGEEITAAGYRLYAFYP